MDQHFTQLWGAYLATERERVRGEVMPAVERVVASLLAQPEDERRVWALDIARRVADEGGDIPIRLPLFRQVILPALIAGVLHGEAGCARWLAHHTFDTLLYHCPEARAQLPDHLQTWIGLVKEARRLDPTDERSFQRLQQHYITAYEYDRHILRKEN